MSEIAATGKPLSQQFFCAFPKKMHFCSKALLHDICLGELRAEIFLELVNPKDSWKRVVVQLV